MKTDKKNRKNIETIYSLVNVIVSLAAKLPKDEVRKLKQLIRKPAAALMNNRIDLNAQHVEQTMRRYYIINMRSCAEIKAGLDLALLKDYISRGLRENIMVYVVNVENMSRDVMNEYYVG